MEGNAFLNFLADFFLYAPDAGFSFTGISFWIFLAVALGGYSLFYKKPRARNVFLLLCSFFFYYKVGGVLVGVLLMSVLFNFALGLRMENARHGGGPKKTLVWGVVVNLLLIAVFKYADSFALYYWGEGGMSEEAAGLWRKVFPAVGLSFFTFQALSYLIDVKRGVAKASHDWVDFALYMCFFPKLVAGPLVRTGEFMPQLKKTYMLGSGEFSRAVGLILLGLVKKVVVSDYLAFNFVNPVFENPQFFTGFETWMAMYAYALRIYCDFSGYTDIALGVAALFDIHLPENFRSPYKASSLTDFWHRWHITLSTWFRDYLYIPLGGNRHGLGRMCAALLLTMVLAGIWHGAGWGFVVWGAVHGILLMLEKLTGWDRHVNRNRFTQIAGWVITFHIVCFGWIFFQASTLEQSSMILERMFSPTPWASLGSLLVHYRSIWLVMAVVFAVMLGVKERQKQNLSRFFYRAPLWLKFLICLAVIALLVNIRNIVPQEFIYSKF
ncbi:MAG: MBOAT family protein [Bacteroidales bacterium]|nr:MBOAT family protein [Bacteroidales bacterium]